MLNFLVPLFMGMRNSRPPLLAVSSPCTQTKWLGPPLYVSGSGVTTLEQKFQMEVESTPAETLRTGQEEARRLFPLEKLQGGGSDDKTTKEKYQLALLLECRRWSGQHINYYLI